MLFGAQSAQRKQGLQVTLIGGKRQREICTIAVPVVGINKAVQGVLVKPIRKNGVQLRAAVAEIVAFAKPYPRKGWGFGADDRSQPKGAQRGDGIGEAFGDLHRVGALKFRAVGRAALNLKLRGPQLQRGQHTGVFVQSAGETQTAGVAAQGIQNAGNGIGIRNGFVGQAESACGTDQGIIRVADVQQGAADGIHFGTVGKSDIILHDHRGEPHAVIALNAFPVFQGVGDAQGLAADIGIIGIVVGIGQKLAACAVLGHGIGLQLQNRLNGFGALQGHIAVQIRGGVVAGVNIPVNIIELAAEVHDHIGDRVGGGLAALIAKAARTHGRHIARDHRR